MVKENIGRICDPENAHRNGKFWHDPAGHACRRDRLLLLRNALADVDRLRKCRIPRVTVENPRGVIGPRLGWQVVQTIQPYDFGDDASKATCLYSRGWPPLEIDPAQRLPGRLVEWPQGSGKTVERWANQTDSNQNRLTPSEDRWSERSKTYPGIARAFAAQYAAILLGRKHDVDRLPGI